MRMRLARLGVLLASVLGLLGGYMPDAEATTVLTVVFAGTATVDGGPNSTLSYPCFYEVLPTIPPTPTMDIMGPLCLGLILGLPTDFTPVSLTDKGIPHLGYTNNHNPSGVGFASDLCVNAGINVNKPGKLPFEGGLCQIGATGVVLGHCGLASGLVSGTLQSAGVGNLQTYTFTVLFMGLGPVLYLQGTITKLGGGTGWVRGLALANEDPTDTTGCFDLHPLQFTIVGGATYLIMTGI